MIKKRIIYTGVISLLLPFYLSAAELPHIGFVYPAGGKTGTVFEVTVGGKYLAGADAANITGENIYVQSLGDPDKDLEIYRKQDSAVVISVALSNVLSCVKNSGVDLAPSNLSFDKDLTQNEKNKRERDQRRRNKNRKNDQFPDTIILRVAIMDNAEPGEHELRVITPSGLSNKLTFMVGREKEYKETEPNNRKDQLTDTLSLPILINGRILQNDVDSFRFKAKKGQNLVIKADVRRLMPYLADAVPGWFQASLALYDSKGNELMHADNFRFSQEPVLFFEVLEDNEYYLEIRDSIYRGREDFVYRLTIGELPYITHIFPLGAAYEKTTTVSIYGVNLPVKKIEVTSADRKLPVQYVQLTNEAGTASNSVPFAFTELTEVNGIRAFEGERAEISVELPVMVNGIINIPGAKDKYVFRGKEGEQIYIEVNARRLGSPLDSIISLYNSSGEKLAENDDDPTFKWDGFITHHSDSALSIKLPKDDTYTVCLADVLSKGGEEYAYRLRISYPMPDFELFSIPSSVTIPRGGSGYFRVHILRKDGFKGPVQLSLKNISSGFKLDNVVIPEGKTDVKVSLSAAYDVTEGMKVCKLEGSAGGKAAPREVKASEEYMQAFAYKHIVPVNEQLVLIKPPMPFTLSFSVSKNKIFELTQGKETRIGVEAVRSKGFTEGIQLQLVDAPDGMSIRGGLGANSKGNVVIRTESKVTPGLLENLILSGVSNIPVEDKERPDNKFKRDRLIVTAPALTVVVLKGKEEKKPEKKEEKTIKPVAEITPERREVTTEKLAKPAGDLTPEKKEITK